jgi:Na+/proline symporter
MAGLTPADLIVLSAYILAALVTGFAVARGLRSLGDYLMAGRRFGKFFMMMHAFATGTHTDQAVAVAGASYQLGLAGIWYQWLWLFSTPFYWLIAPVFRRMRYLTMGDFFAHRYGRSLETFYSAVSIFVLMLYMGLMLQGTGRTIDGLTGGALPMEWAVILTALVIAIYSFAGGLRAAVITDAFQGLLIILFSFLLLPLAWRTVGGIDALGHRIGRHMFSLVAPREVTLFYIVTIVVNALVGVPIRPHQMALGAAGRNELDARFGLTFGSFLKRLCTMAWAVAGLYAVAICPGLPHRELAFGEMARRLLPPGLLGVMFAAVLAGVMSTCDSVTIAGSGLITQNLYRKYVARDKPEAHYLLVGRLASLLLLAGAVVLALSFPSVVAMMEYLWKITGFLGIPFWGGLLWPRANRAGAWAGTLVAAFLAFFLEFRGGHGLATQIAVYLPAGFLSLAIVSLLTPPEPEKKIRDFYRILSVPVGKEEELRREQVSVVYAGYTSRPADAMRLVLVDVALGRRISWRTHRTDLAGFLLSWGIVLLFLLSAQLLAVVAKGGFG